MTTKKPDVVTLYRHPFDDTWRWRRNASNGRIVGASTEAYFRRKDCLDNAKRAMTPCPIRSGK